MKENTKIVLELLNMDCAAISEKASGKSFAKDKKTQQITQSLSIIHTQQKDSLLWFFNDTHYDSNPKDVLKKLYKLGFVTIATYDFIYKPSGDALDAVDKLLDALAPDTVKKDYSKAQNEKFYTLFDKKTGVLIVLETCNDQKYINNFLVYFNWISHDKTLHSPPIKTQSLVFGNGDGEQLFVGYFTGQEGFFAKWEYFLEFGNFITPWVKPIEINLLNFSERKEREFKELNFKNEQVIHNRINNWPDNIKAAIAYKE